MAEYINKEKMLKYLEENNTADEWIVGQYNADWIYSFVESQPTADVVEVVRCKDCIHYKDKGVLNEFDKPLGVCKKDVYFWDDEPIEVLFDDFCSYGERKDA